MTGYLVEEFIENEPTGRSWQVRATDPLEAATKALARIEKLRGGADPMRMKVSPRNSFGRYQFLDVCSLRRPPAEGIAEAASRS